jgi:hypothetical protein
MISPHPRPPPLNGCSSLSVRDAVHIILQRFALATLYYSTSGDQWRCNDEWLIKRKRVPWYTRSLLSPCNSQGEYIHLNCLPTVLRKLTLGTSAIGAVIANNIRINKLLDWWYTDSYRSTISLESSIWPQTLSLNRFRAGTAEQPTLVLHATRA